MPSEELQAPTTETATTEEAHTPTDIASSTAENPENTIYTAETQPDDTPSNIYNIITRDENEGNIESPTTIPQINLTPTPETATDTETYQPPEPLQYTGKFTGPDTQNDLLIKQQTHWQAATVSSTSSYDSFDRTYNSIMDKRKIDTEYLDKTEITLLDTINYIIKLNEEEPTEICALKLTEEIYKDTIPSESEYKQTTRTINAYLDFLKDAGVLEEGEFKNVYEDIRTEVIKTGLFDDDDTTEIMEHTYTLKPKAHDILKSAYKEALKSGIDDIPTSQANELFIDCLENKKDEIRRNTQIAYI